MAITALAGTLITIGVPTPSYAGVTPDTRTEALMNFWFLHSSYETQAECEAAAQEYLWPQNPGGADGYECRQSANGWDLWLMFLT
jgi:hypothetical protein